MIVKIGDNIFTTQNLQSLMSKGISYGSDSLNVASTIVNDWITQQLLNQVAYNNIPDMEAIEKKVTEYRNSLIVREYTKQMIASNHDNLLQSINKDSIEAYYNKNKSDFKLDYPIIQGMIIRIPKQSKESSSIRRWMKRASKNDLENLEKYALNDNVNFQYFQDNWIVLNNLLSQIPVSFDDTTVDAILKNKYLEISDNNLTYILKITDCKTAGEIMPLDFAESRIKEIFVIENQLKFERNLKKNLIADAIASGLLEIYDNNLLINK